MTEQPKEKFGRDQVVKIVNSVINKVEKSHDDSDQVIYQQLQELKAIIDEARRELSATQPSDIREKHIQSATDELDAVVSATAEATGSIMDACEMIEQHSASQPDKNVAQAITQEVTKIYEACSFQDITGQRINKVVHTLHEIENKVVKLLAVVSEQLPHVDQQEEAAGAVEGDETLLNGPQLSGQGVSQDDIDKILAEFDD